MNAELPSLDHLTPDHAVLLAALGVCLGFAECNRPGRVLPGALGLLLFLFACASLWQVGVRWEAVLAGAVSVVLLAANVWRRLPVVLLSAAVLSLVASLRFLVPVDAPGGVHTPTALAAGTVVGTLGAVLGHIAFRARRSKALD